MAETVEEEAFCLELFGVRPVEYLEELGWLGDDVWLAHCVHLSDLEVARFGVRRRLTDERGEGVISTAIAVLIMALIGLLMWTVFQRVFNNAGDKIESNVNNIG